MGKLYVCKGPKYKGDFRTVCLAFWQFVNPPFYCSFFPSFHFFGIWSVPPLWDFGTTGRDQKRRRTKGWTWREGEGTYCPPPPPKKNKSLTRRRKRSRERNDFGVISRKTFFGTNSSFERKSKRICALCERHVS